MDCLFPEAFNPFTTTLTDLLIFLVKLNPSHVFAKMLLFYSLSLIPLRMATSQQCEPAEQSEWKSSQRSHIEIEKGSRSVRMSDVLLQRIHIS